MRVTASVAGKVERAITELRLAVLALLVSIGLTVGLTVGFARSWWLGIVTGVGAPAMFVVALRLRRPRHYLMAFANWLLGERRR